MQMYEISIERNGEGDIRISQGDDYVVWITVEQAPLVIEWINALMDEAHE